MATDSFNGFDVNVSGQSAVFSETRGPPLWTIDTTLLAGQPAITAKRHHFVHNLTETTSLIITLSQTRYPGTQVATDLTVSILEVNGEGGNETSVDVNLAFGNASFSFDADGFVNWLTGATAATAQVSATAGVVAVLGSGEISFGSVTTATVTFTPALLTIAAPAICSFNVFGIVSAGTSVSLVVPGPAPQTRIVVQASSPFSVPLPSPTPLGPLTARPGFDTLTALTTETIGIVTFTSTVVAKQYTLDLPGGLTDLNGAPVLLDLDGGQVQVNLTSTPTIFLAMLGKPSSTLLLTAGIALSVPQPLDAPGTFELIMSFDGSAWTVFKAAVPLPGLFLPLDDGIAEPGDELGQDFSLVSAGANWMVLGDLPPGSPRVHIEDFRIRLTRPQDLLTMELIGRNVALEVVDGQTPTLGPGPRKDTSFWRVVFPPQHIGEQAFFKGSEQPGLNSGGDATLGPPPVSARMAGPTQLAFIVPPDLPRFPVTLANLLDWTRYEQAGTALDNPGQPPPLQRPDLDRQTAIEIPYRLLLSVDSASGWSHTATAPAGLSELWSTRLAFRKPLGDGRFVIDERPSTGPRQGRAYYTPDLDAPEDPVATSLTSDQRRQIAHLSCDPSPAAHAFDVRELMLTALGGTLHLDTGWNPPLGFDVTLWQHTASFGRDQYVRVGQRGFVAPYGHRATKITVSERRFIAHPDGAQAVAYLVQFSYIIITQPVRSYAGLDLPLTAIEFVTRVTPALSAPQPFPNTNASWIRSLGSEPLLFDLTATDLRGRTTGFRAPAIFIEDDPLFENSVNEAVDHFRSDSTINTPVDFKRQKIAFAPSEDDEATTFETATLSLGIVDLRPGGSGTWRNSQTGEPLFRPSMAGASIRHAAAVALAGAPDTVSVEYFPPYVAQADIRAATAADSVDVFLLIDPAANGVKGKLSADKSGVASPAYSLTSISKQFGAVGGKPENILAHNIIPSDFLDDNARFLGDIRLSQILNSAGISQIPNLNTVVNKAPDGTPIATVTTFEWHPPLVSPNLDALSLSFSNSTLDLKVKITAQLVTPPAPPVSELHGQVGNFDLSFADLVVLHFDSMTFDSVTAEKPKIDVTLKKNPVPVEFKGELAFFNALRDLIPSGGFSPSSALPSVAITVAAAPARANGPFLEVTPSQIIAGFALAVPSVGIGVFSLENIRLSAALTLPLEDQPVGFAFNFGERDHKFLLTVDLLAGGGFLAIELSSQGVQRLEFAVEFGANVALNLFVASGSAHVLAGVHLTFTQSEGKSFIAYLRAGGELTVLGLVSISVDFYLALGYRADPHDDLYGIASLTVEVSVAFISKSVTLTMERSFAGSGGGAGQLRSAAAATAVLGAPDLSLIMDEDDWNKYANAFAA